MKSTLAGRLLGVVTVLAIALGSPAGCTDPDNNGSGPGGGGLNDGSGGGGNGGGGNGGFGVNEVPNIELEPSERERFIVDTAMDVGTSQTYTVGIINTGLAPLVVSGVVLDYTPPGAGDDGEHPAFELLGAPDGETTIYPQAGDDYPKGMELQISYTRKADQLSRNAALRIANSDVDDANVTVSFSTESGSPQLTTDRSTIDFPLIAAGLVGEQTLGILNTGTRTLMISGFKITKDGRFGVKGEGWEIGGAPDATLSIDLPEAIAVAAGSMEQITVTFFSDSPSPAEGNLFIYSDDPDSGVTGHLVPMTANKEGPCIDVDPEKVSFGGKVVGTQSKIEVEVYSCGTEPLMLSALTLAGASSPDFSLDLAELEALNGDQPITPNTPLSLPVNEMIRVPVVFVPDAVNPKDPDKIPIPDQGTLVIESSAFQSVVEVPIDGAGAEEDCPVGVIQIEEGDEVIPQTVLHLDGMQSYAPFGAIQAWVWTVEQPEGSQEVLVPSPTDPQPIFQANVVGLYTFTLEVRDENSNWSCKPDVYKVLVQPDQAIHVELTWVTPGDPDETDTGPVAGSDLDLHFAHPNASSDGPDLDLNGVDDPWFDKDWDTFWYNKAPNWGSFDPSAGDDPSLDRDDTDGAGPENLNIAIPEDDIAYHIGVHYWDSHGMGPVIATVRVWTYATLIYEGCIGKTEEECCETAAEEGTTVCEVFEEPMNELDLWCVGTVNWPDPQVSSCQPVAPDVIIPNYVNPFFLSF